MYEKHINNLLQLAHANPGAANAQLAAALVYKKNIITYGFNRLKTHPFQRRYGKNALSIYFHAETDCIHRAERMGFSDWNKSTLIIARCWKNGRRALAKPCPGCSKCINNYNIRRVIYTTEEGYNVCVQKL